MDLSFTHEQEALRDLARQIFTAHVTRERLKEVEAGPEWFDRALWAELATAHLLGLAVPEEHGGTGGGIVELCLLLEQAGRSVAPVPLWPALVNGALPVARFGSPELRARMLPPLVEGRAILTAALAEPDSGDPLRPAARARRDRAGWRLDGVKGFVPAAHLADRAVLPAAGEDGVGLFLVRPAEATLERQAATSGEPLFRMTLSGAVVPDDDVLVAPPGGGAALAWMLDHALVGVCAMQVGVAERALRLTAEYTSDREQFGRPLASFQAVQQRAADAYIDVEAMRWTMWQAAWRLSEGLPATEEVAVAKFWAAEAGRRVLATAQHLHGGLGVDLEYPLHRYTTWGKQLELTLGGASRQLERLGATMAGILG